MTIQEQFTLILQAVATEWGVSPADLTGPRRYDYLCIARHVAIGLASELTKISSHDLGRALNRTDAMVRRSITTCRNLCIADTRIARRYDNLRRTINLDAISEVLRLRADSLRMDFLESLACSRSFCQRRSSEISKDMDEVLITIRKANGYPILSACRPTWREAVDAAMAKMNYGQSHYLEISSSRN